MRTVSRVSVCQCRAFHRSCIMHVVCIMSNLRPLHIPYVVFNADKSKMACYGSSGVRTTAIVRKHAVTDACYYRNYKVLVWNTSAARRNCCSFFFGDRPAACPILPVTLNGKVSTCPSTTCIGNAPHGIPGTRR